MEDTAGALFPYSDIDLLFLYERKPSGISRKESDRSLSQSLWIAPSRQPTTARFSNVQASSRQHRINISLLDTALFAGRGLFESASRFCRAWSRGIADLAQESPALPHAHEKYGQTTFISSRYQGRSGGLRTIKWLAGWRRLRNGAFPRMEGSEELLPAPLRSDAVNAIDFLDASGASSTTSGP